MEELTKPTPETAPLGIPRLPQKKATYKIILFMNPPYRPDGLTLETEYSEESEQ